MRGGYDTGGRREKGRSDFAHDDHVPSPARTRTLSMRRGRHGAITPQRRVSMASAHAAAVFEC